MLPRRWILASSRGHIVVVGGLEQDPSIPTMARESLLFSTGGNILAPGVDVAVATVLGYTSEVLTTSGTSFAAPMVAGAAAFLVSLDPTLSNADLQMLLTNAAYTQPTSDWARARALDLVHAVLGIDDRRGNRRILKQWADMDDGTVDGFLRMNYDRNGVATTAYTEDDPSDGIVDMSDFRRLRDQFLMGQGYLLDGPLDDNKRDLNGDGLVQAAYPPPPDGPPAPFEIYPRGDIAGVPGIVDEADIEMFEGAYTPDPVQPWPAEALPKIRHSADLIFHASEALTALGATEIRATIDGEWTQSFSQPDLSPLQAQVVGREWDADDTVVTTPLLRNPRVRWWAVDGLNTSEHVVTLADLTPGQDVVVRLDYCDPAAPELVNLRTSIAANTVCQASGDSMRVTVQTTCSTTTPEECTESDDPTTDEVAAGGVLVRCTASRGRFFGYGSNTAEFRTLPGSGFATLEIGLFTCGDLGSGFVSCSAFPRMSPATPPDQLPAEDAHCTSPIYVEDCSLLGCGGWF